MEEGIEGRDLGNVLPGSSRKGNRREDMGHHRRTMEDQGKVRWKARRTHMKESTVLCFYCSLLEISGLRDMATGSNWSRNLLCQGVEALQTHRFLGHVCKGCCEVV